MRSLFNRGEAYLTGAKTIPLGSPDWIKIKLLCELCVSNERSEWVVKNFDLRKSKNANPFHSKAKVLSRKNRKKE
jgi:hypothetical protein